MAKNSYVRTTHAEHEIVTHATKMNVAMSELSERMGLKENDLYWVLRNPMTDARRVEIKQTIDSIAKEKEEPEITLDDLVFSGKIKTSVRGGNSDVGMTIHHPSTREHYVAFTFRNNCLALVTDEEAIQVAVYKERIYFRGTSLQNGYKILQMKATPNKQVQISTSPKELLDLATENVGNYDLHRDERLGLFYIEVRK